MTTSCAGSPTSGAHGGGDRLGDQGRGGPRADPGGHQGLLDRVERHGDDLARRSAETLRAFLAELSWSGGEGSYPRESLMAGTVSWIAEREERILVLAHNAHVRREPLHGRPTLGSLLQERWGSDLRVIGMTSGRGPVVSFAERSPRPFDWEATLAEREPVPGSWSTPSTR